MKAIPVLAGLLGLLLAAGCGRPPLPDGVVPLSLGELQGVEPTAKEQIEAASRAVEGARGAGEAAAAYGELGQVLHAYGLLDEALAAYRNAELLDPQSFAWAYCHGLAAAQKGDFAAATAAFGRAQALRPESAAVRLRRAEAELQTGDLAAADADFAAAAADPLFAAAGRWGRGRVAVSGERWADAVTELEAALAAQPRAGVVRAPLAQAYRRLAREDEAVRVEAGPEGGEPTFPDPLAERLESLARSPGALFNRGSRALVAGELDRAVDLLARSVALDPARVEARRNLAQALGRRGQLDRAAAELEKGIAAAPESPWLHVDLGTARLGLGDTAGAIAALRRAVELAPDLAEARFDLANALAAAEQWSGVEPEVAAVLAAEPANPRALYLQGMAALRLGRPADGAVTLARAAALDPEEPAFADALAEAQAAAGREADAVASWRRAATLSAGGETRAQVLGRLAEFLWRRGRRGDAVAAYRDAVATAPESSWAHTQLANVLQLTDRRPEAIAEFARASELDPGNAAAWLSEGTLHVLDGDFATAKTRLEAGLARVPSHVGLAHTLARLLATAPDAAVRDGRRALELAQLAQAAQPSAEHADTVAMAYAELGRYSDAVLYLRSALQQLAQGGVDRRTLTPLAAHLQLYERGEPVRIAAGK